MHCECCDKLLDDEESTAHFADDNKDASVRYVGMCRGCRKFLPKTIKILTRSIFDEVKEDRDDDDDFEFDLEDDDGYEEDE